MAHQQQEKTGLHAKKAMIEFIIYVISSIISFPHIETIS
jgi:hypothetical protein